MNKKILLNHWVWFVFILTVYTLYDIYDHVARVGSVFEEHPWEWALFSLTSQFVVFLVIFVIKFLLDKLSGRPNIITDSIAIGAGITAHVYVFGSMINQVTFPYAELTFFFSFVLPGIFIGFYLIIRGILFLPQKRLRQPSS